MYKWIKTTEKIKARKNDSLSEKILKARGIKDIDNFLLPDIRKTHSWKEMLNIEWAIDRINKAVENGEKLLIFGDPDADGISSTATLYRRIVEGYEYDEDLINYIYSERDDGHGINSIFKDIDEEEFPERFALQEHNKKMLKENCDLLIIVDSSSNDFNGILDLNEYLDRDIDILVLDHHNVEEENIIGFDNVTLVNPQQEDCEYPNKNLSGVGVVYKLCQGLDDKYGEDGFSDRYLDLVAVGMCADMMDVTDLENRYLIMQGMMNIKNVGITRILKGGSVNIQNVKSDDIGFTIAPMINACGRMGNISIPYEILLTDDDKVAKKLRLKMRDLNEERKSLTKQYVDEYKELVDIDDKIIVIIAKHSNKGFNGLIAQNIALEYSRPCFILNETSDGMLRGSGRSYNGFSTKDFLSDLDYVHCEGHNESHGLDVHKDDLDKLKKYINENMKTLTGEKKFFYDTTIEIEEIPYVIKELESLNHLTGTGFYPVIVRINGIMFDALKTMGKANDSIKITTDSDLQIVKFRVGDEYARELEMFDSISVIGKLVENVWYNFGTKKTERNPQLMMNDYRVEE